MEKNELLLNINETKNMINKLQNTHRSLTALYKEPIKFGCLGHLIAFFIYWASLSYILSWVLGVILYPIKIMLSDNIADKFGSVVAVILVIIVALSYPYLFNLINKKHLKQNDDIARSSTAKNLELEKQSIIQYIETHSVVPADYRYLSALNTFEKYLINKRADSLKECINLFEQEIRHEEQINEIRILQEMQAATYQKASEAATIGWIDILTRR